MIRLEAPYTRYIFVIFAKQFMTTITVVFWAYNLAIFELNPRKLFFHFLNAFFMKKMTASLNLTFDILRRRFGSFGGFDYAIDGLNLTILAIRCTKQALFAIELEIDPISFVASLSLENKFATHVLVYTLLMKLFQTTLATASY